MKRKLTESDKVTFRCELLDMVMESSTEGIVIVGADREVIFANPAMEEITGYKSEELLYRGSGFLRHELDQVVCDEICKEAHQTNKFRREITVHKKNGGESHILLSMNVIRNEEDEIEYFLGLLTNVTEMKNAQRKLEYLASHDLLTGLPNRGALEERLEQSISRAIRLNKLGALLFVDLDCFKKVNDSLGHCIGDELLKDAANRLKNTCRLQDVITRYGGDEFIIVLEDVNSIEEVNTKAQRLLDTLQDPFTIKNHELNVSASIGISLFPRDGETVSKLVRKADLSMYKAKDAGRNQYSLFEK